MTMLENYSRVRLQTDNYQSEGAFCFDVGYIIEVYPGNKYEVEFSKLNGITTAQIAASEEKLEPAPPTFTAPKRKMSAEQTKEQQK
jgi:hypothetical protein